MTAGLNPRTIFLFLLRVGLGGVFLWSGVEKLFHATAFEQAIMQYKVFPLVFLHFYGFLLPKFEVLTGLYLLLGVFNRFAAMLASAMTLSFVIAMIWMLVSGQSADCGCFLGSTQPEPIGWNLVLRDMGLLLPSLYFILRPLTPLSLDALAKSEP